MGSRLLGIEPPLKVDAESRRGVVKLPLFGVLLLNGLGYFISSILGKNPRRFHRRGGLDFHSRAFLPNEN